MPKPPLARVLPETIAPEREDTSHGDRHRDRQRRRDEAAAGDHAGRAHLGEGTHPGGPLLDAPGVDQRSDEQTNEDAKPGPEHETERSIRPEEEAEDQSEASTDPRTDADTRAGDARPWAAVHRSLAFEARIEAARLRLILGRRPVVA
jgi:hypothetical protein